MIKNFLITGDCHGRVIERLADISPDYIPAETALVILGDAGINFYLNKTDEKLKKAIEDSGFIVYCVRGNHEERPENLPVVSYWYDPDVASYVIIEEKYPNIRYLQDGHVYTMNGNNVLVLGGAYSVDKWYRLRRFGIFFEEDPDYTNSKKTGWFPEEQLYDWEMEDFEKYHFGKEYDIILSHTCPRAYEPIDLFLPGLDQSKIDKTMEDWLDKVKIKVKHKLWLFGHFHADRVIKPGVEMFYRGIKNLNDIISEHEVLKNE